MRRPAFFGLGLALFGTLVLTPDALLMRLSGMDGFQMVAWRGMFMGAALLCAWALSSRDHRADFAWLGRRSGRIIIGCQFLNSILFCLGIAIAPVTVVLMGVAAVPVCAAILAWAILGEATRAATWVAIGAVLIGLAIAISGKSAAGVSLDRDALLGALCGLGVAWVLALNFVVLRARPALPIALCIGVGALIAGALGMAITGIDRMPRGEVWAMALTGAVVLPVSFFCLSLASRHTHAANVSLIMLLELVLGPLWVWLALSEAPTARMMLGGGVVVLSLLLYLLHARWGEGLRRSRRLSKD